jgi:hypothetical protein
MQKIVAITTAAVLTIMSGAAFAQNTGAPAAAQSDPAKPGMGNPEQRTQGTTGAATTPSPRGDASTSGAGTAAGPNNTGTAKEPDAVQKGVNKR